MKFKKIKNRYKIHFKLHPVIIFMIIFLFIFQKGKTQKRLENITFQGSDLFENKIEISGITNYQDTTYLLEEKCKRIIMVTMNAPKTIASYSKSINLKQIPGDIELEGLALCRIKINNSKYRDFYL